jgi:integrase
MLDATVHAPAPVKKPKHRPFLTKEIARDAKGDPDGRYELRDKKVMGLRLAVQTTGQRSWVLRYTLNGKDRKWTIGEYSDALGLAEARDIAADAKLQIVKGGDPATEKTVARRLAVAGVNESLMFAKSWSDWQDAPKPKARNKAGWRPSTAKRVKDLYVKTLEPRWGKRRLDEIGKVDVAAIIEPIGRKHPQAAARIHRVLASFFNWCVVKGRLAKSPVAGIETAKTNKRKRKLTDAELRWLWKACEQEPFPMGLIVRLLMLTLARRNEVSGMNDRELHFGNRRAWIIPEHRTKNHKEHEIFLTDAMIETIKSVPRVANKAAYVFCTNGKTSFSGFSKAKKQLDKIMLEIARAEDAEITAIPNWTLHDLRRTGASRMQRLGFDSDTTDACLNHSRDDAYLQHDFQEQKAEAFDAWSRKLLRIVV